MKTYKSIKFLFIVLILSSSAYAQKSDEINNHKRMARANIDGAKVGIITQKLNLTVEEAEKFWPIYNEYDNKRKSLVKTLREIKKNRDSLNDKKNQELVNSRFKIKQELLDLEKEYSKRLSNIISQRQLLDLLYVEQDFHRMLLHRINNNEDRRNSDYNKKEE